MAFMYHNHTFLLKKNKSGYQKLAREGYTWLLDHLPFKKWRGRIFLNNTGYKPVFHSLAVLIIFMINTA